MAVIKIKSVHPESQGDYVLIEAETFDKSIHEVYVEEDKEEKVKKELKEIKTPKVPKEPDINKSIINI